MISFSLIHTHLVLELEFETFKYIHAIYFIRMLIMHHILFASIYYVLIDHFLIKKHVI